MKLKKRGWCTQCNDRRITVEKCMQFANANGGICLSKNVTTYYEKIRWQCGGLNPDNIIHQWDASLSNAKKAWCKKCNHKITLNDCKQFAESKNGKCLSAVYGGINDKMTWSCNKCGDTWENSFDYTKRNKHYCKKCAGIKIYSIEYCRELASKNGCECLSEVYKNIDTDMLWKCNKCNREWYQTLRYISKGKWCRHKRKR
jgi:hypothetical protein